MFSPVYIPARAPHRVPNASALISLLLCSLPETQTHANCARRAGGLPWVCCPISVCSALSAASVALPWAAHPTPWQVPPPTWCRSTCCCFCCIAASPRAVREEIVRARGLTPPSPRPSAIPRRSQYLGGGFDEPLLFLQGCDDGDVAHRLVGVLLVLGDTQPRIFF